MKNKKSHKESLFNGLLYGVASLIVIVFVASIGSGIANGLNGQGSILSIFNKIGLTNSGETIPDVGIEYVYLRKIANPSAEFDYYKYQATIIIRNYGEELIDGDVVVSAGENQKNAFVQNSLDGLSLDKGQTFVFDDYEVLMDGRYNYGQYKFEIELKDQKEKSLDNNEEFVDVYEEPSKLESLEVASVGKDGEPYLSYELKKDHEDKLSELDVEICLTDNVELVDETDMKYSEIDTDNEVYSYYKIKATSDLLMNESFKCQRSPKGGYKFENNVNYVLYFRGTTANDAKFFASSNLLYLPVQKNVNRAEFTRLFTKYANIELDEDGKIYFKDVSLEDWYAPYVQTMFNYGLLRDTETFIFEPDSVMTRAEILEAVLNHFDVDLDVDEGAPHYADVPKDHENYFFAESLYASGKAKAIGIHFYPDKPLSSYFLKYVIDEFSEKKN